ncbi:MAG: cysteine--tRNA ligase [Rickettsiales bacterium]|nr:cysteine--tRNA ligase [Rickettsiales bacterium]
MQFFNSLTNKLENFTAIDPQHLKIYVCGPTVYDRPHLGNARSVVVYDLLFRFLREVFPQVTFVRNITDVDDKINAAAKEQKISIQDLTKKIIALFYQDIDALNVLRPTFEPRATNHIAEMILMINQLIKNGFAYENSGHVLFDVTSYKNYGKLSNRTLDEMIAGARVEIASYKKNPLDFVLWKPADTDDDISSVFESPWGSGRPGWHIECSAMSSKYLGSDFDIHGGGADLQFPHHENEIAQSCCANQGSNYARFWIHNGFLTVNGEKMSKSLKNFITVRDLLDKGISGLVIRYLLMATHYHKPFDFNQKALDDAKKSLEKFYASFDENDLKDFLANSVELKSSSKIHTEILSEVLNELADNLNIAKVLAILHEKAKEIKVSSDKNLKLQFLQALDFLGLFDANFFTKKVSENIDENYINQQIELRIKAKQEKNWALSDQIRNDLLKIGISLKDNKDGTSWHYNSD